MSSVWPGGSSRWARPPASQPPEAAASSAQCRSPRGGSWASWRKGWAMTRRGIRCWPLPRCSRTAAPRPDAHGVRSQPRFFFVSLPLSLLLSLPFCRGWWCRCSSLFACCLLLPSLGVPCFCRRLVVQPRRSSTGSSRLSRAHTSTAHPSRTPPVGTYLRDPPNPLRSSSNPE